MDITQMYFDKSFTNMNTSNVDDYLEHVNVRGTDSNGKNRIYIIGLPFPNKCPYKHKNCCVDYNVITVTRLHQEGVLPYEYTFAVLYKCTLCNNYLAVNYDEICSTPNEPESDVLIIPYFFSYINKYPFSVQQKSIINDISPIFKNNYLIGEKDFYRYKFVINDYAVSNKYKEHLYKIYCNDCRKELEIFICGFLNYEKRVWIKKFNSIKSINNEYISFKSVKNIKSMLPELKASNIKNDSLGKNIGKFQIINQSLGKIAKFLSRMGNYGSHADIKDNRKTYKKIKLNQIHQLMYDFIVMTTNYILNNRCNKEVKKCMKIYNDIISR